MRKLVCAGLAALMLTAGGCVREVVVERVEVPVSSTTSSTRPTSTTTVPVAETVVCTKTLNVGEMASRFGAGLSPFDAMRVADCVDEDGRVVRDALSREFVEQLSVESNDGSGASFTLWATFVLGAPGVSPTLGDFIDLTEFCSEGYRDVEACFGDLLGPALGV